MTAFEYLSVALSFVLGLGVTHLLLSAAKVFKRRDDIAFDWVSWTWAATIFIHQLHFWWVAFSLSDQPEWSLGSFAMLLSYALFLFAAGALILPEVAADESLDLYDYFSRSGRWALMAVLAYDAIGIPFDYLLWEMPLVSRVNGSRLAYLAVLIVVFTTKSRGLRTVLSFGYFVALLVWIGLLAPESL